MRQPDVMDLMEDIKMYVCYVMYVYVMYSMLNVCLVAVGSKLPNSTANTIMFCLRTLKHTVYLL